MAAEDILSKGKADFLAILIPGFYVVGAAISVGLVMTQGGSGAGLMERFSPVKDELKGDWVLVFVLLVLIFLVGNLLRSIRVNMVDKIANRYLKRFFRDSWWRCVLTESLPYRSLLEKMKNDFIAAGLSREMALPEDNDAMHNVYNYWKSVICIESPGAYSVIQDLEGRVRMFAGMSWAGILGVVGSLIMAVFFLFNHNAAAVWWKYALMLFAISMLIVIAFCLSTKRMRSQEVSTVFISYLCLKHAPCAAKGAPPSSSP